MNDDVLDEVRSECPLVVSALRGNERAMRELVAYVARLKRAACDTSEQAEMDYKIFARLLDKKTELVQMCDGVLKRLLVPHATIGRFQLIWWGFGQSSWEWLGAWPESALSKIYSHRVCIGPVELRRLAKRERC